MTCSFPLLLVFLTKDPNLGPSRDFHIIWKLEVSGFVQSQIFEKGRKLPQAFFSSIVDPSTDLKVKLQIHILRRYWYMIWKRRNN